jgi:hypothetical protein
MTAGGRELRRRAVAALLLLVPVPSVGTWAALVAFEGPVGQVVFALSKAWILALPLLWLLLVDRGRPRVPAPVARGMGAACASGLFIVAAILAGWWLAGRHWVDPAPVREQVIAVGLDSAWKYVAGAAYWCTVNALLEEYVWRWFVPSRCEALMPRAAAIAASGLFFTLHHVIALRAYFDWRATALGSLGVFLGGATWSWLYLRYRNIWAAWVSHVFADVTVFALGWRIIFA